MTDFCHHRENGNLPDTIKTTGTLLRIVFEELADMLVSRIN